MKKPRIRKFNKKLKKIDDENDIIQLEEELLLKHNLEDKIFHKKDKW